MFSIVMIQPPKSHINCYMNFHNKIYKILTKDIFFNDLFYNMIAAGEESGATNKMLM